MSKQDSEARLESILVKKIKRAQRQKWRDKVRSMWGEKAKEEQTKQKQADIRPCLKIDDRKKPQGVWGCLPPPPW